MEGSETGALWVGMLTIEVNIETHGGSSVFESEVSSESISKHI